MKNIKETIVDSKEISETFVKFLTIIGSNIAKKEPDSSKLFTD